MTSAKHPAPGSKPAASSLDGLEKGDLIRRAMDVAHDRVSIYKGPRVFLAAFRRVPRAAGLLYAAFWADAEICNGGLHQFFNNSTGVLAPEAVEGFRFLGMPKPAALLRRSMEKFGKPYPRARSIRYPALWRLRRRDKKREPQDVFYELDEAYFKAMGDFESRADDFVRRHMDLYFR